LENDFFSFSKGGHQVSLQGKQFSPEMIEMVVHLKSHFDEERKSQKSVSTKDPAGCTAAGLGIGVATVKRIMSRYSRSSEQVVVSPAKRPGKTAREVLGERPASCSAIHSIRKS
jgi:hypothetical protein